MNDENYKDALEEIYGSDEESMILDQHLKIADKAIDEAIQILEKVKDTIETFSELEQKFDNSGVYQDIVQFIEKYSED